MPDIHASLHVTSVIGFPILHLWAELREKFFHNKAFDSLDALEDQLETGLRALENNMPQVKSIVAWDWIVNALLN